MALANVEFSEVDGRYQSSPIKVTGQNVGIQIDMERQGDVMLEMSIDGVSYANNTFMQTNDNKTIVGVISNAIPGMFLRLQFFGLGQPSKIQVIQ